MKQQYIQGTVHYNIRRYVACARRWRKEGNIRAAVLMLNMARYARTGEWA